MTSILLWVWDFLKVDSALVGHLNADWFSVFSFSTSCNCFFKNAWCIKSFIVLDWFPGSLRTPSGEVAADVDCKRLDCWLECNESLKSLFTEPQRSAPYWACLSLLEAWLARRTSLSTDVRPWDLARDSIKFLLKPSGFFSFARALRATRELAAVLLEKVWLLESPLI